MNTGHFKIIFFLFLSLLVFCNSLFAQPATTAIPPSREERFAKFEKQMIFPLIKGGPLCGIMPVEDIVNKPDPEKEVKLIFDFTQVTSANQQGSRLNEGLEEVARTMNLHIAAGVKKEKLKTVIVFHSNSIFTTLNNEYYQKKYESNNPNNEMFGELLAAGTELVICGQSVLLRNLNPKEILPSIQMATSAKTTISKYMSEGYIPFIITEKN